MFSKVNLEEKLRNQRDREIRQQSFDDWIQDIFDEIDHSYATINQNLVSREQQKVHAFKFDLLDSSRIFHIDQIKKICIDYRLRFLDTQYFKGDFPATALSKIRQLQEIHQTQLNSFKIIAPSKLFVLKKADDPLLFAPMGNDYYYLIHKWGNDIHPMRKLMAWPTKNVGNLTFTIVVLCALLTLVSANFVFNDMATMPYTIILFLFYFKFAVGFLLFYGIALGKNFNEYIWQSKYNKIS